MKRLVIIISLFSSFGLFAQTRLDSVSNIAIYVSKKKTYAIQYNLEHWRIGIDSTKWDVEFHDVDDVVNAYFIALNYFIPKKKLKETILSQYEEIGKVKNLKIYKKRLNHIEVDYFECELMFEGYKYKHQGFFYSGQRGSMELQFRCQEESLNKKQKLIEEFCNGVAEIK
jgi:hypothetical protein